MNLKVIHIVFVVCSSLLAFVIGGWAIAQGGGERLAWGIVAFVAGVGLIAYGVWFWRKITTDEEERRRRRKLFRSVPALVLFWLLADPQVAAACSVCYGEAAGPMIDAARLGVFLLFGLVFAVQVAFVVFFVVLYRRAKRYRRRMPHLFPTA